MTSHLLSKPNLTIILINQNQFFHPISKSPLFLEYSSVASLKFSTNPTKPSKLKPSERTSSLSKNPLTPPPFKHFSIAQTFGVKIYLSPNSPFPPFLLSAIAAEFKTSQ